MSDDIDWDEDLNECEHGAMPECGPVTEVIEPDEYGGVKIVFSIPRQGDWQAVRLTSQHWEAIQAWVLKESPDFGQLLAVATLYVKAFEPDEMMSLPEKLRLQEIEDILDRHGRRY